MTRGGRQAVPAAVPPARDFTLPSREGVTLAATYWPGARPNAPAVLLLHGVGASRAAEAPLAAWLAAQGYAVLTIDFRGHGGSTLTPRSFGWYEAADAHAALAWLRGRGHGRVAIVGVSMGGAAALLGAAGPARADALVLQCVYPDMRHAIRNRLTAQLGPAGALLEPLLSMQAYPRFGIGAGRLSPLRALRDVRSPMLVIGGTADRYTPPAETRALFDGAPAGKRMLWLALDADHGQTSVLATPEYHAVLLAFLRRTIGPGVQGASGRASRTP